MSETVLATIRIVLVEPAGPLNVGAIARVMKNMGLRHLVLVNPHCDPLSAEARQMAVHASDVLAAASVVATLPEALRGCQRAIATTARPRAIATRLEHPRTVLPWLLKSSQAELGAIIFGPEDRGLSNEELNYAQRFLMIPTSPTYPSLNLAQAVAICCYELYQWVWTDGQAAEGRVGEKDAAMQGQADEDVGWAIDSLQPPPGISESLTLHRSPSSVPAPLESLDAYYQHLEAVLLKIGYLYPHTADSRMQKFRRLFGRTLPSSEEVAMLRGILSQIEWAIQKSHSEKK